MTEDNELDPLARLRAADPAAGVEPGDGFTAEVIARAEAQEGDRESAPVVDLGAARSRRHRLWLPIAAVAASVAVFGGAGFAVGAATTGGSLAKNAAAPITISGGNGSGAVGQGYSAGSPEGRQVAGASTFDQRFGYGFGRNTFTSSGLSTSAGSAKAYGFDARSASNATTISAFATALGITTEPTLENGSWTAGAQDGSGPSLSAGLDGTLGFYFSDPKLYPSSCVQPEGAGADDSDSAATVEPCVPSTASTDLPSEDAATASLRSLIAAAGKEPGAFEFASETPDGATTRLAQAWPVVDGQRIDQAWSVELTDGGIVSASGFLAPVVDAGDYPIVSEQQAFERLSDPRFGAQQTAMPLALRDQSADPATEAALPTEPPATPTAGSALSWSVNQVHIVGARLGLTSQWQPDGSVLVVPAYEFTDADGGTWSVIAVADAKLDFSTR